MITTVGELSDMYACRLIEHGLATEKKRMTFDEMLMLR